VLRSALLSGDGDGPDVERVVARVQRDLPGCSEHLGVLLRLLSLHSDAHPPPEAERSHAAILVALRALFAELARTRPVVLVLSDWHWADRASELALNFFAETVDEQRLLVLVDFRPPYRPHWAATALRLDLPALRVEDTRSIIHRIVGSGAPDALVQRIYERTGGNPLFVEEVSRALVDLGVSGRADADRLVETVVPDNVAAVLRARIDRLPAPCVALLKLASVLGETFPQPLLRDVCDPDLDAASAFTARAGRPAPRGGGRRGSALQARSCATWPTRCSCSSSGARSTARSGRPSSSASASTLHGTSSGWRIISRAATTATRRSTTWCARRLGRSPRAPCTGARALLRSGAPLGEMPETPAQMRSRVDITLKLARRDLPALEGAGRGAVNCLGFRSGSATARAAATSSVDGLPRERARGLAGRPRALPAVPRPRRAAARREAQALVYTNLGQTLFQYGEYEEAMQMIEDGVKMRRRTCGDSAAGPLISYPMTYQAMIHAEQAASTSRRSGSRRQALACASGQIYTEAVVGGRGVVSSTAAAGRLPQRRRARAQEQADRLDLHAGAEPDPGRYARCFDGQRGEGVAMLRARASRCSSTADLDDDLVRLRVPGRGARARR
jgi:hypothetical protein